MTSKEIIKDEIKVLEHKLLIYEMDNNKPKINILKTEIETKDIVLKDLEILEEIRDYFKVIDYGEEYQNRYALQVGNIIIPELKKETYDKWNRWLNNGK